MSKVLVFGIGQFAELAHFYLKKDTEYTIAGFMVDEEYRKINEFKGLPVYAFEGIDKICPPGEFKMFIPISYKGVNKIRADRFNTAKEKGYSFISYISPRATFYNTPVGENCFIFENNVIQPFVEIGNNVIIWSGNHLGHHTKIGDHCFISSGVVISGSVIIEPFCFLGVNSTIRDNLVIKEKSVIGAGSLILDDVPERSVFSPGSTRLSKIRSDQLRNI